MRAATALGLVLLLGSHASAQVPFDPSPTEGPLTEQNITAAELDVLFAQGLLRHEDGSLPHLNDPIFGDDFFAIGADCVNGANVPVWHWHRFDIDGFIECGHGAVILAQQNGGGGDPGIFSPEFLAGELLRPDSLDPDPDLFPQHSGGEHGSAFDPTGSDGNIEAPPGFEGYRLGDPKADTAQPTAPDSTGAAGARSDGDASTGLDHGAYGEPIGGDNPPQTPRRVTPLAIPHILEFKGGTLNTQFTFDTTVFITYTPGLAGISPGGGGAVDLYIFDQTTGVFTESPGTNVGPGTPQRVGIGPIGDRIQVNGLDGSDQLHVDVQGPLGGPLAVVFADPSSVLGFGPAGLVVNGQAGDDTVLIGDAEAKRPDDAVYPLQGAFDKMIKKISGALAGPDQKTLADILRGTYTGTQPKTKDGVTTPGKSLEDAAKDAVEANKDALKKNPDAKKVYEGLQEKARKDAQSSDAHDSARGRQWQRVLDAVGKAAGWPTSAELTPR